MDELHIPELDVRFYFRTRAASVPGDLRPLWRMNLVLLLLRVCCRSSRSSFARLHVLSWAAISKENQRRLLSTLETREALFSLVIRIEPFLNRAVDLAIGEELVRRVSGDRYQLTPRGVRQAELLLSTEDCFDTEKDFLKSIGRSLTETAVNQLFKKKG